MAEGDEYKGLSLMADGAEGISASYDGALYNFVRYGDYVFKGIGNEFNATYSSQSLIVTIQNGMGVCGGRQVTEKKYQGSNSSITLPANSSGYLCIRVNPQPASVPIVRLVATSNMLHPNINRITEANAGRDLPLYAYITNDTGIVQFIDIRPLYRGNDFMMVYDPVEDKLYADMIYNGEFRHIEIKTTEVE